MANSYVTYTGNGATVQYNVTFAFLSRSHVAAYLDGVETSAFTWISDSLIQFNAAPGNGVAIKIARETPTTPLTDFVDGSTLTEDDLDNALLQSLYVAEEAADRSNDALNLNTAGTMWDAESKIIDNVAEPTATDHAATKNYVDTVAAAFAAGVMPDNSVTNAKLADMAQTTLKGRAVGAGTGDPTDLTPAQGRLVLGLVAALDSFWTAVSVAAGRVALGFNATLDALWTAVDAAAARTALALGALATKSTVATADIDNDAVTYAKVQNVSAADKLLGRGNGGGAGDVQEITLGTNLSMSGTTLNAAGGTMGLTLIQAQNPSGAAQVDFTTGLDSTYDSYLLVGRILPATDDVDLWLRTDADGGASFDAAANDYSFAYRAIAASAGEATANTLTEIRLGGTAAASNSISNAAEGGCTFWCQFTLGSASQFPTFNVKSGWTISADTRAGSLQGWGTRNSAAAINAIRVLAESGNITGHIALFGVRKS
jgi:hypothetical protein